MKILQIGMGNVAGGLEAFVMNYYRVLVHMDIQFDFVCMYDKIAYEEEIRKLGGRIYYIPNVKKNYQGYIKELKKILKETKYDAVHVNMLSAAYIVTCGSYNESAKDNCAQPQLFLSRTDQKNHGQLEQTKDCKICY